MTGGGGNGIREERGGGGDGRGGGCGVGRVRLGRRRQGRGPPAASGTPAAPLTSFRTVRVRRQQGLGAGAGLDAGQRADHARGGRATSSEAVAYLDSSEDGYVPTLRMCVTARSVGAGSRGSRGTLWRTWSGTAWTSPTWSWPRRAVMTTWWRGHTDIRKDGLERATRWSRPWSPGRGARRTGCAPPASSRRTTGIGRTATMIAPCGTAGARACWSPGTRTRRGRRRASGDRTGAPPLRRKPAAWTPVSPTARMRHRHGGCGDHPGRGGLASSEPLGQRDVQAEPVSATHDSTRSNLVRAVGSPRGAGRTATIGPCTTRPPARCARRSPAPRRHQAAAPAGPTAAAWSSSTVQHDLTTGKGRCFARAAPARPCTSVSVSDDRRAYGTTGRQQAERRDPVVVSLTTGFAVPLTKGLGLPWRSTVTRGASSATADVAAPRARGASSSTRAHLGPAGVYIRNARYLLRHFRKEFPTNFNHFSSTRRSSLTLLSRDVFASRSYLLRYCAI